MSSTSETGHHINVANFESEISFCTGYGAAYNPSNPLLFLANLTSKHSDANKSIIELTPLEVTLGDKENVRAIAFAPIKKLGTRIVNSFAVSGASALAIADAQTINRKLQGVRAKPKKDETTTPPPEDDGHKNISVSQQSFDSIVKHFRSLLELVSADAKYKPNEADLKVAALQSRLTDLNKTNTEVINANTNYENSKIARNNMLYNPETGLVKIALDVKKYVKSVFGASSPEFKQVNKLKFATLLD